MWEGFRSLKTPIVLLSSSLGVSFLKMLWLNLVAKHMELSGPCRVQGATAGQVDGQMWIGILEVTEEDDR